MTIAYPRLTPCQWQDPSILRGVATNFAARLTEIDADHPDAHDLRLEVTSYADSADQIEDQQKRFADCSPRWLEFKAGQIERDCREWAPNTIPHDEGMEMARSYRARAKALRKAGVKDPQEDRARARERTETKLAALHRERRLAAQATACIADRSRNDILRATMTAADFEAHQVQAAERAMEIAALDAQIAQEADPRKQHQISLF